MSKPFDHLIKLLVIGDSSVGKSCLLLRFCDDEFTPSFITTVGIDFKIRTISIDNRVYKLQIWDTAGQERFRTITNAYYRGAMGIIIAFDITNRDTFQSLPSWLNNVETQSPDKNVSKILIGTKVDLAEQSRHVSRKQAKAFALESNMPYIEVSSKENVNVDAAFITLVKLVIKRILENDINTNTGVVTLEENIQEENKNKCCL